MVGLEVRDCALHDVYQEADGGEAVVGLFPDEGGQFLVQGGGFNAEDAMGAEIFSGWSGGAIFVDEGLCGMEAKVEELTGGVEAVAGLGIFEEALHDVD